MRADAGTIQRDNRISFAALKETMILRVADAGTIPRGNDISSAVPRKIVTVVVLTDFIYVRFSII